MKAQARCAALYNDSTSASRHEPHDVYTELQYSQNCWPAPSSRESNAHRTSHSTARVVPLQRNQVCTESSFKRAHSPYSALLRLAGRLHDWSPTTADSVVWRRYRACRRCQVSLGRRNGGARVRCRRLLGHGMIADLNVGTGAGRRQEGVRLRSKRARSSAC
jgi:hypothetical protein